MRFLLIIILYAFVACKPEHTAQQIIDSSLKKSGVSKLENSTLSFIFRDKFYQATRNYGAYEFLKTYVKNGKHIKDILSNKGFQRFINDTSVALSDINKTRFSNSINSVHYFSILPLGLNDQSVNKKLLKPVQIKGKEYHKIQITFDEQGGGDDFDDIFIYWFNKQTFTLDYIAYKYHTNGGGIRFRDIKKEHVIHGIRLADYNNYKPLNNTINFNRIDELYEENKLKKLSEIVLEDIKIKELQTQ